ncbi:SAM-dependent methyltransferase [Streptomyces sp. NPDC017988]|uniref:SAM-dependent methyltransferase n=1 Tax=Streptomyces sp. NPDC017988 TaxID=3365025 RepID=UPI00379B8DD9
MTGPNERAYAVLPSRNSDTCREHVARAYQDDPADWQKVLGEDLHFQWGVYDHADPHHVVSLDEAGFRHLEQQLAIAADFHSASFAPQRILDVGCGWGATLRHLATMFPACPRIDGINISSEQLIHCADRLRDVPGPERVHLYLCDAADIDELPDKEEPYDLVLARGAITHFPPEVLETAVEALARRLQPDGLFIISETFYGEDFLAAQPPIPSDIDHLALRHRKSLDSVTGVIEDAGLRVRDRRELPSQQEAARWVLELKANIDAHFPKEASPPIEAIRGMAADLALTLLQHNASVHSIIASR